MFTGRVKRKINKDGRVSIPSQMRETVNEEYERDKLYLLLMPGSLTGKLICLYPDREFKKLATDWFSSNSTSISLSEKLSLQRIGGAAEECKVDGSGRIVISPLMRQEAGIQHEVLVVGSIDHIEIWDPKLFEYQQKQDSSVLENLKAQPALPGVAQ